MSSETDNGLLHRWQAERDARAFRELATRHTQMVFATCKRILGNISDAEDVTQECFLTLAQHAQNAPQSLPAWLHTVAVRLSLNRLRSRGRQSERERKHAENVHPSSTAWGTIMGDVDQAIAELPESLRAPVVLHFLEERSQEEIAGELGLSQSTVSRRISQGIEQIRAALRGKGVALSLAALADEFKAQASVIVPTDLAASLGKLALGAANESATAGSIAAVGVGGILVMKKIVILTAGAIVLIGSIWLAMRPRDTASLEPNVIGSESQPPTPQSKDTPQPVKPLAPGEDDTETHITPADPSPKASAVTPPGGAVFGRVYDVATGDGVAGVTVSAEWGRDSSDRQTRTATSASNGTYRIEGLNGAAGTTYSITRNAPAGYRTLSYMQRVSIQVNDDGTAQPVDFPMEAEVPLGGIVVDTKSKPVAEAKVRLAGGVDTWVSETMETGADGTFAFHNLAPTSDLHLIASKDDIAVSEPLELSLSEDGLENLVVMILDACSISGTIVSSNGTPLAEHEVKLRRIPDTRIGMGDNIESDAAGRFHVTGLPPGAYELITMTPKIHTSGADQRGLLVELQPGEQLSGIELVYDRDLSLAGRVVDIKGNPVAGAKISASSPELGGGIDATSDESGQFVITELAAGMYGVRVSASGYQFSELYEVPAGKQDLEIIAAEPYHITGRVLDAASGQPVPEFEIALTVNWGDQIEGWDMLHFTKFVNAEGRFELTKEQSYRAMLAARAPGYATAFTFLDLTGPPYSHDVELKLEHGGDLAGRVVDAEGKPIQGVAVFMGRVVGIGNRATAKTDAAGSFTLPSFPLQRQAVSAYHPDYAVGSVYVDAKADGAKPIEIVLMSGGSVQGTVSFPDDAQPVPCQIDVSYAELNHFIESNRVDVASDGTYRVDHVGPGELVVSLAVNIAGGWREGYMVKKSTVVEQDGLSVVDFEVAPAQGTLDGTVVYPSGTLPRSVSVRLDIETPNGTFSRTRLVTPDGAFRFEGVPAGVGVLAVDANFQNHRRISGEYPVTLSDGEAGIMEISL